MNRFDNKMKELEAKFVYAQFRQQEPHVATDEEISRIEKEIGYQLPPDYREFLRDYGGFHVRGGINLERSVTDDMTVVYPGVHYGILPGTSYDILKNYRYNSENFPAGIIAIGVAEPGYLCIATTGDQKGSVYYWDSRGSVEEIVLVKLADSFTDYINQINSENGS